jgi:hypothetical protein
MTEFKHPLAQNKEQYEGYTVFHLNFNGSDKPIKFIILVDAKIITQRKYEQGKKDFVKRLLGRIDTLYEDDWVADDFIDLIKEVEKNE